MQILLLLLLETTTLSSALQQVLSGYPVHRVLLRPNDPNSLYGLAVSAGAEVRSTPQPQPQLQQGLHGGNFLATQVWPSSRVACLALERWFKDTATTTSSSSSSGRYCSKMTICEFGCGPGLPSLMAAKLLGVTKVIATDVDDMALQLVQAAAQEQQLDDRIETRIFDLTNNNNNNNNADVLSSSSSSSSSSLPFADLYLFSDVFESNAVARGAAHVTRRILSSTIQQERQARVWVFCQSDRVQRDMYIRELQQYYDMPLVWQELPDFLSSQEQEQTQNQQQPSLWRCNVDETQVPYL